MQRDRLITSICIFAILVILLSVFKTKSNKQREGYTNYVDPVKYNHDYKLLEMYSDLRQQLIYTLIVDVLIH
mgnify:CR=1 FL=1